MAERLYASSNHRNAPGERELTEVRIPPRNELTTGTPPNKLDSEESRKLLRQLLRWYYYERDRQAANRLEMAIDADFYDNLQWAEEDAATLSDRGQLPLVFNEVAPMCDWVIGTERRTRVDWKVMPRTDDDIEMADVKTKVMKFHADVNKAPFARSRAFEDAVKAGIGWVDDGVRDDPTAEILYSRYEDWRNVLWDSSAQELDLSDARYLFRWRWVDEDIACLMFPGRADRIKAAVENWAYHYDPMAEEETWVTPTDGANGTTRSGSMYPLSAGFSEEGERRRVKLIECQYRMPVKSKIINSGPLAGAFLADGDRGLMEALGKHGGTVIDKVVMRVHVAVFTETDLLAMGPSVFRHNRYSLTPIWCYRRSRDRLPYGMIRRARDIQRDLNKRASKALWLLNTNQIHGEAGAFDDIEEAREEAQMPDGVILGKKGYQWKVARDTDAATGQLQLMAMDQQSIQRGIGVTDENRGLRTNATSEVAIRARVQQGTISTTLPFDNLRYAVQTQGEKVLSLTEQFYSEQKVIRLSGAKNRLEWVRINTPETQPDGSVRYINDITATMADFVVSEQDYAGTLRQVMFESISQLANRLPPEVSLRVLTIAMEFSDLPNKDEIAAEIRRITGDRDPNGKMSEEEAQQAAAQQQAQAEAMQMQRESAVAALEEQRAKVREINARADQLEAEAERARMEAAGAGGAVDPKVAAQIEAIDRMREQLATEVERLSRELAKEQANAAGKLTAVRTDADTRTNIARIQAASAERIAEMQRASDKALESVLERVDKLAEQMGVRLQDAAKKTSEQIDEVREQVASKVEEKIAKATAAAAPPAPAAAPAPAPAAPAPAPQPAAAAPEPVRRTFRPQRNEAGDIVGGDIVRSDGTTERLTVKRHAGGDLAGQIAEVQITPAAGGAA